MTGGRSEAAEPDAREEPHAPEARGSSSPTPGRVWIVSAGALALYLLDSLIRHARFHSGFDLTIFDQAIDQYAHLRAPDVLVKSQQPFNILGDHFHPILVLLAPFYRLWPDARVLLVAQALLIAVGVHIVCRLSVRRLGGFGYFLGAAFAVSWGILQAVDFDFHEIAFAVPLLALALEALLAGRYVQVVVFSSLLVLVKEDSPLLVVGIALVLGAQRRYRPAVLLGLIGVASFLLIIFLVIPFFSYSHTYTYFAYAGAGQAHGLGGLLSSALHTVFSRRGLIFLGALAITTGLGLRSPVILAILPTLAARLVSNNYAYTGFLYHYNATLMVICFVALGDGLARQRRVQTPASGVLVRAQTLLLAGVVAVSLLRAPPAATIGSAFTSCDRCTAAAEAVARIPVGARVAADVFLMPHLVDRAQVMQAYPGFVDPTGLPIRADWVVLDLASTSYTPGWSTALLTKLTTSGRYREVARYGQYVVLESTS
jgi:uncharacterized membrane protein